MVHYSGSYSPWDTDYFAAISRDEALKLEDPENLDEDDRIFLTITYQPVNDQQWIIYSWLMVNHMSMLKMQSKLLVYISGMVSDL